MADVKESSTQMTCKTSNYRVICGFICLILFAGSFLSWWTILYKEHKEMLLARADALILYEDAKKKVEHLHMIQNVRYDERRKCVDRFRDGCHALGCERKFNYISAVWDFSISIKYYYEAIKH